MLYVLIALGLILLADVGYALKTGVLHVKLSTIRRDESPKAFWFTSVCFVLIGAYMLWLAYWDWRLL